jgi:hypothetical protein
MEAFSIKEAINYIVGALVMVIGWDVNRLNDVKEKHADFREEVAKEYVTRSDLRDFMDRTDDTLDRILEKLDTKKDK